MRLSLKSKMILLILLIAIEFSVTSAVVSNTVMTRMIRNDYYTRADDLAKTVAASLDVSLADKLRMSVARIYYNSENKVGNTDWDTPEYQEYVAQFTSVSESGGYERMLSAIRKIQDVNNVDCIYLTFVDPVDKNVVYVIDAAEEDPCPCGSFDPLYEFNYHVLEDPEAGFAPYVTDTEEYGELVTAAAPIMTSAGKVAAYATVDISMETVRAEQNDFIVKFLIILSTITVIGSVVAIVFVNRAIVKPINMISKAAGHYNSENPNEASRLFEEIKIKKRDEIGVLAESIKKMERDINAHIDSLISVNRALNESRRVARRMNELANKDALTGLRNKLAYDDEVKRLNEAIHGGKARFGIAMIDLNFLKKINDNYGHEQGNEALCALSGIICETFVHSPVFRIGGDEFVIILENNDYDKIDMLVGELNEKLAGIAADQSLKPWERVSAAIGYSLYEPGSDLSVDDVFRRADGNMYARKKQMKSTRENDA